VSPTMLSSLSMNPVLREPAAAGSTTTVVEVGHRPPGELPPILTPPPPYRQEPQLRHVTSKVSSQATVREHEKESAIADDSSSDTTSSASSVGYLAKRPKSSWRASSANLLSRTTSRQSSQLPSLRVDTGKEATLLEKKFGIPRSPSIATRTGSGRPNAPGIPLPPEVVDTLRISIACFPETMLLSTSLSIETIRAYSRKVKHTRPRGGSDGDTRSIFSVADQAHDLGASDNKPARRWNLPRLLSPWRVQQLQTPPRSPSPIQRHYQNQARYADEEAQTPAPGIATKPIWQSIKNIFPQGSNYLCDALYAHLVAYNYIGDLCASLPSSVPFAPRLSSLAHVAASDAPIRPSVGSNANAAASSPTSGASRSSIDDPTRIPKKAASLLGLSELAAVEHSMRANLGAKQKQKQLETGAEKSALRRKDSGAVPGHASEQTLRELHAGLARCVMRLIATLQATSASGRTDSPRESHGGEETFLGADGEFEVVPYDETRGEDDGESRFGGVREVLEPHAVDPLVMRALIEVVKATEERIF
jgi:hypothetical protein